MAQNELMAGATEGYVYMIEESISGAATGQYKIGRAVESNLNKRLSDLRTGNPRYLAFKHTVKVTDYVAAESAAQKAVASYISNLGGGSEWYQANSSQFRAFEKAFLDALNPYLAPGKSVTPEILAAKYGELQLEDEIVLAAAAVEGYVYMIEESITTATGFYKVGKALASSIDQRLRNLQTGNPRKLSFEERVLVTDYTAAESAAQKAVVSYKSNLGGGSEWYKADSSQFPAFKKAFDDALKPYKK